MIVPDYIERSNRKTLSLSVLKDGVILVKAPLNMKDDLINNFVEEKQDWIKSKLLLINKTKDKFEDVINYKTFLLYGNKYKIVFSDIKKIETTDSFQIVIPKKYEEDTAKTLKTIISWYKKIAREILLDRLGYVQSKLMLTAKNMKISDSKGRWGSCNSAGIISFNWRVIMLPPKIIDYVIVHELCHLVEMNHSKKFWDLVNKYLPDVVNRKKEIKEYGFLLGLFKS